MNNDKNDRYIFFPERYSRRKLNSLYRKIPLSDTTFRTLRKNFNAMAHLYGIITLEKAYEIISVQNPSLVSREEFRKFAEIARHECEDYVILGDGDIYIDAPKASFWKNEIIEDILVDEDLEAYFQTKVSQEGKPFYIPKKKGLLLYSDPDYFEKRPASDAMWEYLEAHFGKHSAICQDVFEELAFEARYISTTLSDTVQLLEEMGMKFKNSNDVQHFAKRYQDLYNTTRMQCNRGHTPEELRNTEQQAPKSISFGPNIRNALSNGTISIKSLYESILTSDEISKEMKQSLLKELKMVAAESKNKNKKIGRNDPCPCGSGKKYKHCCGR